MNRSMSQYIGVIEGLKVETTPRYQKTSTQTFCNYFAQDVMSNLEASLPSGRCADMLTALENGFSKWKYLASYLAASFKAQDGIPTIAITSDHIAVVRPYDQAYPTGTGTVRIAQAGSDNFSNDKLSRGWGSNRFPEIKYYYWNE